MTEVLTPATAEVSPDEKAYWLIESWQRTPLGDRRIQRIQVMRGDAIAVYEHDVGPWNIETDQPFQAVSLWEYSVAELQDIAMEARSGKPPTDPDDRMDILDVWTKQLDERRMRRAHRSTFGHHVRKVRA